MFKERKKVNTVLPDFWPEKTTISDTSTLNIKWFPEVYVNKTQILIQRHLYYSSHTGVRIHGVYIKPASIPEGTTIPGMVLVHGGGFNYEQVYPLGKNLAETFGFGILCIDSPGVSSEQWSSSGQPETAASCANVTGPDGPRGSFYYHNVIALLRGVTVMQSLSEINSSLVGLCGFSGGGIASLIANGVESKYKRLKFAVHMAVAGEWTEEYPRKSPVDWYDINRDSEKCDIFLQSYEPVNYAALAYAPSLMVCITNDQFFKLKQFQLTFKAFPQSKTNALSVHIGSNHWFLSDSKMWEPVKTWSSLITSGEEPIPIPVIESITRDNNIITITVKQEHDSRIEEVGIIYNFKNLNYDYNWEETKQAIQEGNDTYTWMLDKGNTEEFAFCSAVYYEKMLLFSTTPIFING
ncbi:MAG: acetylxylan esterase [Candidatus Hodarchaeales archaeon]